MYGEYCTYMSMYVGMVCMHCSTFLMCLLASTYCICSKQYVLAMLHWCISMYVWYVLLSCAALYACISVLAVLHCTANIGA